MWQDPVPESTHAVIGNQDIAALKGHDPWRRDSPCQQLVSTAWASAATSPRHRTTAVEANGARLRLAPQEGLGRSTSRSELGKVLQTLEAISAGVQRAPSLTGRWSRCAGRDRAGRVRSGRASAAKDAGHDVEVPFSPGRADALQEQTDVDSFAVLEPTADGFSQLPQAGTPEVSRSAPGGSGPPVDAHRP